MEIGWRQMTDKSGKTFRQRLTEIQAMPADTLEQMRSRAKAMNDLNMDMLKRSTEIMKTNNEVLKDKIAKIKADIVIAKNGMN